MLVLVMQVNQPLVVSVCFDVRPHVSALEQSVKLKHLHRNRFEVRWRGSSLFVGFL